MYLEYVCPLFGFGSEKKHCFPNQAQTYFGAGQNGVGTLLNKDDLKTYFWVEIFPFFDHKKKPLAATSGFFYYQ
jgi:hypothetical protein